MLPELNHLSFRGMGHTFMTERRDTSNAILSNNVGKLDDGITYITRKTQTTPTYWHVYALTIFYLNYIIYIYIKLPN